MARGHEAAADCPVSDSDLHTIRSARLDLLLLSPEALRLSLDQDSLALEEALRIAVPPEWYAEKALVRFRLDQLKSDPECQPWSLRAISFRDWKQMIGYINCHTKPGDPYLHDIAPQGVEYGFQIFPDFRRQGYADEACRALMKWAHDCHHVSEFVVSISPDNIPSLRLAEHLGFRQAGSHIDEVDGLEYIFRLDSRASDAA